MVHTTGTSTTPPKELYISDFVSEGRRPSLAELITIYESGQGESEAIENTTRLPVLQET